MPDAHYTDPRMVALYDTLCGWSADRDFYLSLADETVASVLDAGCGTGLLTVAFVRDGRRVVGVDPAEAMLAVARQRPGGGKIRWQCTTLQDFRSDQTFDLIIMTGHAFQCLLTDEEILAALRSAAALLSPGGRFVFETRNPLAQTWLKWQPETSRVTGSLPDGTAFDSHHRLISLAHPFVTFEQVFQFGTDPRQRISASTLRFAATEEIVTLARQAGLGAAQV
jgi:2-polyprenyl-3-methyl-5-hydroxy-6-metoxy-1,4-benzoquinol methylase